MTLFSTILHKVLRPPNAFTNIRFDFPRVDQRTQEDAHHLPIQFRKLANQIPCREFLAFAPFQPAPNTLALAVPTLAGLALFRGNRVACYSADRFIDLFHLMGQFIHALLNVRLGGTQSFELLHLLLLCFLIDLRNVFQCLLRQCIVGETGAAGIVFHGSPHCD